MASRAAWELSGINDCINVIEFREIPVENRRSGVSALSSENRQTYALAMRYGMAG